MGARYLRRLVDGLSASHSLFALIAAMKADNYSDEEITRHVRSANTDRYGREYDPLTGDPVSGNESYLNDDEDDGYAVP